MNIRKSQDSVICPYCNTEYEPMDLEEGYIKCGECGHEFRLSIMPNFYTYTREEYSKILDFIS